MNRRSAAVVIERLCRTARVDKAITPHSLRRSFATLALQAGVPIEIVQFDMDHESTRTTQHYNRLGVELHARASNTVAALLASAS
jgi:site-specific recombinase XerD